MLNFLHFFTLFCENWFWGWKHLICGKFILREIFFQCVCFSIVFLLLSFRNWLTDLHLAVIEIIFVVLLCLDTFITISFRLSVLYTSKHSFILLDLLIFTNFLQLFFCCGKTVFTSNRHFRILSKTVISWNFNWFFYKRFRLFLRRFLWELCAFQTNFHGLRGFLLDFQVFVNLLFCIFDSLLFNSSHIIFLNSCHKIFFFFREFFQYFSSCTVLIYN